MLAAKNLLDALSAIENDKEPKDENTDFDLGEVLKFCAGDSVPKHEIRYSNERRSCMDLKVGDKVLVTARYSQFIEKVAKITPAGNIRLTNGSLYMPDGRQRGGDIWSTSCIQPLTPELEESLRRTTFIKKTLYVMHEIKDITYEQAIEIRQILEGDKDGKDS